MEIVKYLIILVHVLIHVNSLTINGFLKRLIFEKKNISLPVDDIISIINTFKKVC